MESPIGNEYLNSSLLPLLPSQTELPSRLGAIASNQANADLTKHSVALGPAPAGKRSGSTLRQATLTTAPKKRMSTIGVASSLGRLYKVLGDLFLLAGRVNDALVWCVVSAPLLQYFFSSTQVCGGVTVVQKLSRFRLACISSRGDGHSFGRRGMDSWTRFSPSYSRNLCKSLY